MTAIVRRRVAVAVALAGPVLAAFSGIDDGHFPVVQPAGLALYGVVVVALLVPLAIGQRTGRMPTALRLAALLTVALGAVLLLFASGLIFWVAPLLLIAADLYAMSATDIPTWPLLCAVGLAVGAAALYGAMDGESPSAWLGAGLLWLVPFPYFLARERLWPDWEEAARRGG